MRLEAEQYHPSSLASDIYQGLGGMYAGAKAVSLQSFKASQDDYHRNVERSWRCGLLSLGYKPAELDAEIKELRGLDAGDDEVDNSVKVQGDTTTHIHLAPGATLPTWPTQPLPQPPVDKPPPEQPKVEPQQPKVEPQPNTRTPAWVKWAAAGLIGSNLIGGSALVWNSLRPQSNTGGGSIFAFDTELPPWMQPESDN